MWAKMADQVQKLSSYLCVSCGKISTDKGSKVLVLHDDGGRQVKGLISIAKYLARKSNMKDILGRTAEDQAVVDQWLEYREMQVDGASHDKDQHNILKELDNHLYDKVYLVGFYPTIADVVLYLGMYSILNDLTFYDKQRHLHVCRWFDQVQHLDGVQPTSKIHFQKNLIYSGISSH